MGNNKNFFTYILGMFFICFAGGAFLAYVNKLIKVPERSFVSQTLLYGTTLCVFFIFGLTLGDYSISY